MLSFMGHMNKCNYDVKNTEYFERKLPYCSSERSLFHLSSNNSSNSRFNYPIRQHYSNRFSSTPLISGFFCSSSKQRTGTFKHFLSNSMSSTVVPEIPNPLKTSKSVHRCSLLLSYSTSLSDRCSQPTAIHRFKRNFSSSCLNSNSSISSNKMRKFPSSNFRFFVLSPHTEQSNVSMIDKCIERNPEILSNQKVVQRKICDFFQKARFNLTAETSNQRTTTLSYSEQNPGSLSLGLCSIQTQDAEYESAATDSNSLIIPSERLIKDSSNIQGVTNSQIGFINECLDLLDSDRDHQKCQYLSLFIGKNIHDANNFKPIHNYFTFYENCDSNNRITPVTRKVILLYMIEVGRAIPAPVSDFSIHIAINLFDRYLSALGISNDVEMKEKAAQELEIVGAACLFLSSKLEDCWTLSLSDICKTFDEGSEKRKTDILFWELEISKRLNFQISCPTLYDFLFKMIDLTIPFLTDDCSEKTVMQENCTETDIAHTVSGTSDKRNVRWASESIQASVGPKDFKFSSTKYFSQRGNISSFHSQLLASAASIGELVILHHASIGTPVHLLAAASLLMAITKLTKAKKSISSLPQPVRIFLGQERAELAKVMPVVCAILEERDAVYKTPACHSVCSIATTASSRS